MKKIIYFLKSRNIVNSVKWCINCTPQNEFVVGGGALGVF